MPSVQLAGWFLSELFMPPLLGCHGRFFDALFIERVFEIFAVVHDGFVCVVDLHAHFGCLFGVVGMLVGMPFFHQQLVLLFDLFDGGGFTKAKE